MDFLPTGILLFIDNAMNNEGLTVSVVALQSEGKLDVRFLNCQRLELTLPANLMGLNTVTNRRLRGFLMGYKALAKDFADTPAAVICGDGFIALGCSQILSGRSPSSMNPRYGSEWQAISRALSHSHVFLSRSAKVCPILASVKRYAELRDEVMIEKMEQEPRRFFCNPTMTAYTKDEIRAQKALQDEANLFT